MKASLARGMPHGFEVGYSLFSINGRMLGHGEPVRVKPGERVLFHVLNASATEIRSVALPGHSFTVVALDGNPVRTPVSVPVCHGPFAGGNNQNDDYPMGANLRATRLDAAGLKLTISCGRAGTGMPSFDEGAYSLRSCYERPLGDAPTISIRRPRPDQIDAVIAYLQARIIGVGTLRKTRASHITRATIPKSALTIRKTSIMPLRDRGSRADGGSYCTR
jgi:hypothetical protein